MHDRRDAAIIAHLIERLQDADPVVRIHAATVLGALGTEAGPAVPALIQLLQKGDVRDRKLAALTLGEIGPAAAAAVPLLLAATNDPHRGVAEMALWALEQVDLADAA